MRLLILLHVLLCQAFLAIGDEAIVASPEEIARREPDGDHILQEESQAPQVIAAVDGEVAAAAIRQSEARRYPSRKEDKFKELMEETDIQEIRRIIVPKIIPQKTQGESVDGSYVEIQARGNLQDNKIKTDVGQKQESPGIPTNREIKFEAPEQVVSSAGKLDVSLSDRNGNIENDKTIVITNKNIENKKVSTLLSSENPTKETITPQTTVKEDFNKNVLYSKVDYTTQIPANTETPGKVKNAEKLEKNELHIFQDQPIVVQDTEKPQQIAKPSAVIEPPKETPAQNVILIRPNLSAKPSIDQGISVDSTTVSGIVKPSIYYELPKEDPKFTAKLENRNILTTSNANDPTTLKTSTTEEREVNRENDYATGNLKEKQETTSSRSIKNSDTASTIANTQFIKENIQTIRPYTTESFLPRETEFRKVENLDIRPAVVHQPQEISLPRITPKFILTADADRQIHNENKKGITNTRLVQSSLNLNVPKSEPPPLVINIHISYDDIAKVLHSGSSYSPNYVNYEPILDGKLISSGHDVIMKTSELHITRSDNNGNVQLDKQNSDRNSFAPLQRRKRCKKIHGDIPESNFENVMPIAEALYRRRLLETS